MEDELKKHQLDVLLEKVDKIFEMITGEIRCSLQAVIHMREHTIESVLRFNAKSDSEKKKKMQLETRQLKNRMRLCKQQRPWSVVIRLIPTMLQRRKCSSADDEVFA